MQVPERLRQRGADLAKSWVGAVALGLATLLIASWLAWLTWGSDGGSSDGNDAAPVSQDKPPARTVISKEGGFSVTLPRGMSARRLGDAIRLSTTDRRIVVTAGPSGTGSARVAHDRVLDGVREAYKGVKVERTIKSTLAGAPAVRSIGTARVKQQRLVVSVTTSRVGRRTFSVTMFASRDLTEREVDSYYEPILSGFQVR